MARTLFFLFYSTLVVCIFCSLALVAVAGQEASQHAVQSLAQGPSLTPLPSFSEPVLQSSQGSTPLHSNTGNEETVQNNEVAGNGERIIKNNQPSTGGTISTSATDISIKSEEAVQGLPTGLTHGGYIDVDNGMSTSSALPSTSDYSHVGASQSTSAKATTLSAPYLYEPISSISPDNTGQKKESAEQATLQSVQSTEVAPLKPVRFPFGKKADTEITLFVPAPENDQIALYYTSIATFLNEQAQGAIKLIYAPGRGGADALNRLTLEKSDGSFMAGMMLPAFLLQPMMPDKRFDQQALVPLVVLSATPTVLWVAEKSPIKTVEDLVRASRRSPSNTYIAGTGSNTGHHITTYVFNRAAGVTFQYLAYLGSRQAAEAVISGTALACWGAGTPTSTMKGLRPIAIASPVRSPFYPKVPTFSERGITLNANDQLGLCVLSTTDEGIRNAASDLFVSMTNDSSFIEETSKLGFVPAVVPYAEIATYITTVTDALHTFLDEYPMGSL